MWTTEHSAQTDLDVTQLWQTFVAVHSGAKVLPGGDRFSPDGDLAVGTRIQVTPAGQDTMTSVITQFEPEQVYADETQFNGLVLTFKHTFDDTAAGTRISHVLTITGDAADEVGPKIGPQISADFPDQMDALIEASRRPA